MPIHIGSVLKRLRLSRNLTLRDVEKHTGISNAYLSQLENGRNNPGLKIITKLSELYEVPIDTFIGTIASQYEIPSELTIEITSEIIELLSNFRLLTKEQKRCVLMFVDFLASK